MGLYFMELKRRISPTVAEFNLVDAEHIASIPSRENRAKALEQIHPDRREHVKQLVIDMFKARTPPTSK